MNTPIRIFAALLVSFTSYVASAAEPQVDRLAQIHSGRTADEVRALVGAPPNITRGDRAGDRVWIYEYTDAWGYESSFQVTFDAKGIVTDTYSEREDD